MMQHQQKTIDNDEIINLNDRLYLKCNQKCLDEKQRNAKLANSDVEIKQQDFLKNKNQNDGYNYVYYVLGLLVLVFAVVCYLYLLKPNSI